MLRNKNSTLCALIEFLLLVALVEAGSLREHNNEGNVYRLPLLKIEDSRWLDGRFEQVFERSSNRSSTVGGRVSRSKMANIAGANYFTQVKVGNPAKQFRVGLTIDSNQLVIISKNFPGLDEEFSNYYDSSQSVDYEPDSRLMNIRYPEFGVAGNLGRDTVELAGIKIQNQIFVQVSYVEGTLPDIPIDGVLGLGVREPQNQADAMISDLKGPFESLIETKSLSANVFSLSLNHKANSEDAGELILGGIVADLFKGNLTWTPMIQMEHLRLRVDTIQLRNLTYVEEAGSATITVEEKIIVDVCKNGCMAHLSTMLASIIGSGPAIFQLNDVLGATHIGDGVYKMPDCSLEKLPNLVVVIAGQEFVLTPDMLVTKNQDGDCYSVFMAARMREPVWVLGEIFLANLYAAFDFDQKRIGLAESVYKRPKWN